MITIFGLSEFETGFDFAGKKLKMDKTTVITKIHLLDCFIGVYLNLFDLYFIVALTMAQVFQQIRQVWNLV